LTSGGWDGKRSSATGQRAFRLRTRTWPLRTREA